MRVLFLHCLREQKLCENKMPRLCQAYTLYMKNEEADSRFKLLIRNGFRNCEIVKTQS